MSKIFVSWSAVSTDKLVLVLREKADLLSEVARSPVYSPPHPVRNYTFDNLNPVMHTLQVWSTVDGTTLVALKGACDIDASLGEDVAMSIIPFVVGRGNGAPNYDPADGDNSYINPDMQGKTYLVFKPGYGALMAGYNIQDRAGGGFDFIDGSTFIENEEYTVLISNLVGNSTGSGKSYPEDVVTMSASRNIASSDYNKMILVTGAGLITLNIPDINLIGNGVKFGINTQGGTSKYLIITLPSGVTCNVRGVARNILYVGRGETVTFIKKPGTLHVVQWDGDINRVGELVYRSTPGTLMNAVLATGGWVLKTDEPRLAQYAAETPDAITGTDDIAPFIDNLSKWINGTNKFWVPDFGGYFLRAYDPNSDVDPDGGSRAVGSHQSDGVGPHKHKFPVGTGTGTVMPDMNPNDGNTRNNDASTDDGSTSTTPTIAETRPKNAMQKVYIIT